MSEIGLRHLLGTEGLRRDQAIALLDTAASMEQALTGRAVRKLPTLRGRTVVTLFYENSTRTRVSFEVAGKWMSADTINVSASGSSVGKGESLRDTASTIAAAGADAVVVRHPASGAPHRIAAWLDRVGHSHLGRAERRGEDLGRAERRGGDLGRGNRRDEGGRSHVAVVNAGDGTHEHPTQALLDAATLRARLGTVEGVRVAIVGDVLHSRVARSNAHLLATLGAEVTLVAPPTLLPVGVEQWPVRVVHDLDAHLATGPDAVMMLRVQAERMHGGFFPSAREYAVRFGLSAERADRLSDDAVVLHPGPAVRGMEIASAVADSPRAAIADQVTAGVHVRMAVLYHLLAGDVS